MAKKIEQLTVSQLYNALAAEIAAGNGNKYLVASDDNEGNGYHGIYFGVEDFDPDCLDLLSDSQVTNHRRLMVIC